ncbi:hypothetical protein O6H91_11G047900 [Diphasiastrum complanatum]|uniref:Uncharacterized protein n=1 Tax=Diphasiastrum complanatum TaxID=34168 RepID=A0ACC2C8X5_DIPCM|nr:hypothetical protein O6H91_11G047900 [Diphasiastrum complanatum]
MVYISRSFLCGLLFCCLLSFPNVQNASGRVLEIGNHLQFREVTTPGEQKIEALKGVVSVASWLKVHTGSPLIRGGTFLKNNLWKKSKSHEPSFGVGSLILSGDHAGFDKLDKGTPTPGSGPSPGGNQSPLVSQHKERVVVHGDENLATNSLPKGWNVPSGPSRLHQEKADKITRSVDNILKEEASESEKQALQSASESGKDEGDAEKLVFNARLLPEGITPPSGPNPGHNDAILAALDRKNKLTVNSLPKGPTTPPGPNPGHNAVIASEEPEKLHLELLPQGPNPPSGPNPGHNGAILAALEGNKLAVNSLPKSPTTPSGPNPVHNAVIRSEKTEKLQLELLPAGVNPPSGPNPGHNGAILAALEGNKLAVNSLPKGPTTPPGPNPVHNAVIKSEKTEKLQLELLPTGVNPPSGPNPGHNGAILAALEGNKLAANSLPEGPTTPPGPNPVHNAVIKRHKTEKLQLELLPTGVNPSPGPNPGHNGAILADLEGNKLAVNSLPKGPITSSGPNPVHKAVIKSEKTEKLQLEILPKGVNPPSGPNPGHNGAILAALEGNKLAVNFLPKGPTTPLGPNPVHNAVAKTEKTEKLQLELLPTGVNPPSGPNPVHNAANLAALEGKDNLAVPSGPNHRHDVVIESENSKKLRLERLQKGPVPPSSPNPIHDLILNSKLVEKELPAANQVEDVEIVHDSSSTLKTLPGSNPSVAPEGFAVKHSLEISEAHFAAESAKPNSLEDKALVLNKLPKSPGQTYKSSPNLIHYSIHTTASQKKPVSDDHKEICELHFDSRQNFSELVGCQQDIMPMAPATLFRPAVMQQGMHNFFAAGIARDTLPRS